MVGKVVGKRRKRPLPDSKSNLPKSTHEGVTSGPTALPSPAPSLASEHHRKRVRTSDEWQNTTVFGEQAGLDFSQCDESQFFDFDLAEDTERSASDESTGMMYGLPTPSVTPPEMQFLPATELATGSASSPTWVPPYSQSSLAPVQLPGSFVYLPQSEDDESVCIKLLAHLKHFSAHGDYNFAHVLLLIDKTNTTLRSILRSRTIRSEYVCHLLLTSIILHLTAFCEQLLDLPETNDPTASEVECIREAYLAEVNNIPFEVKGQTPSCASTSKSTAKLSIQEAIVLCSSVGDLLKRKPLNGFQILGKQESAHVETDIRLKRVLASLV